MKQLRQTIRRLILESQACENLNGVLQGAINQMVERDLEIVYYITESRMQIVFKEVGTGDKFGILKATTDPFTLEGECWGGYMVSWAKVNNDLKGTGLGALMYDVALELVADAGLMADRNSVSTDALRNWKYFKKSTDYIKKPLDNKDGEYTSGMPEDDCASGSYFEHGGSLFANSRVVPAKYFRKHPLNQVVVKKDQTQPTFKCLQGLGRIRVKGE